MARNSFYTGSVANAIAIDTSADEAAASATAAANSASGAANSATAAASSYDNFDDRYLGAKSSAPSTDNDSNSLVSGALYWNTSSNQMYAWTGSAWNAIKPDATQQGHINTVSGIQANVSTVAGISSDVTAVAGIASDVAAVENIKANITAVAGDATDIGAVAAKATQIGLLGTSAAVADLAILGTSAIVADMAILGTNDVVADLNTLGTSDVVSDMNTLAAVSGNITTVAGIASNVTAVASNTSNINAVAGNATNINAAGSSASSASTSKDAAAASAATATTKADVATAQAAIATTKAQGTAADRVATAADVVSSASNAAAAAATYDGFDDRYLGSKSSEPSQDNDGNSLVIGALYYNSSDSSMKVYTAAGWIATSSATLATMNRFVFTATNNQTIFQGNDAGGDSLAIIVGAELVTLNGVVLEVTADYAVTTSRVTLASGAAANDELNVYAFGNFEIASHYSKTAADARFEPLDSAYTKSEANTLLNAKAPIASPTFTGNIGMPNGSIDTAHIGDDQVTADKLANSINSAITANTAKTGISSAQTSAITANTAKTGITSAQANAITANTAKTGISSAQTSAITANTSKTTNATHSGEVTGSGALTIADNVVDEANLKVSNSATNGHFLSAQSGASGGMTWAAVDALPSQSGNSGKFLTTDATNASWAVLDTDANSTTKGLYEMANVISANYVIGNNNNAMSAGPITINSNVSVTVPSGSTWVIA